MHQRQMQATPGTVTGSPSLSVSPEQQYRDQWYRQELSEAHGSAFQFKQTFSVNGPINAIGRIIAQMEGDGQTSNEMDVRFADGASSCN